MNYKISFQERVALAMIQLSKQSPVTLEMARKQAKWLKENSITKHNTRKSNKNI